MSEDNEAASEKMINTIFPTDREKILGLATYCGVAFFLSKTLMEHANHGKIILTLEELYQISLVSQMLMAHLQSRSLDPDAIVTKEIIDLSKEQDVKKKFRIIMRDLVGFYNEMIKK